MKFFIYSRKSVYTGKGDSIENQIELCRQFILLKYPDTTPDNIKIYEDEGFSGKNLNRPQFQQMYDDFSTLHPDFLVCYRLDRISRSIGDFATLFEVLNQKNISFLCIKENFDTSTPMGKAMLYITSVFAQLERETIAERVRDNMHQLARTGRWLGGTSPLGFTSEQSEVLTLDGKSKIYGQLKPHANEQEIVRTIYDQYLSLQSISAVQKYLHRQNILPRSGRDFSALSIKEILKNPVYCTADEASYAYFLSNHADICFIQADCSTSFGLIAYNKRNYTTSNAPRLSMDQWIVAIGAHRGLISGAQWVKTQQLLTANKTHQTRVFKHTNNYALLSGCLHCTQCGSPMFAKRRSNRGSQFDYICSKKLQFGASSCSCINLTGHNTDKSILNKTIQLIDFPHLSRNAQRSIQKTLSQSQQPDALLTLNNQITIFNQELDKLTFSLTQNNLSETFIHCVSNKMDEIASKRTQLEEARATLLSASHKPSTLPFLCRQSSDIPSLPIEAQRSFLRCIINYIQWDGNSLHICLHED